MKLVRKDGSHLIIAIAHSKNNVFVGCAKFNDFLLAYEYASYIQSCFFPNRTGTLSKINSYDSICFIISIRNDFASGFDFASINQNVTITINNPDNFII